MYKQLLAHEAYVTAQLSKPLDSKSRRQLLKYHTKRVRDFQHERLIHLLVTLFFGGLLIGAFIAWLVMPVSAIYWPLTLLVAILFVLEIAYIWHYYHLENGVQSLYELTDKLGKID